MKKILVSFMALLLIVMVASCKEKQTYTITFETNGGSAVEEIKAEAGASITKPADPTQADLTFGGWYADIDLTETYEFPATMPSANVVVYAKWVVTLTFDSNGGSTVDPIVAKGGSVFNLPADPTREGYAFVGWYTDADYKTKLTYVMPKKNTTAYARWQLFENGSAIDLGNDWQLNDANTYTIAADDFGTCITATAEKLEWAYAYLPITCDASKNLTFVAVVKGTKDCTAVFKLEGGTCADGNQVTAIEQTITFTGEEQRIEWTVEAKNLTGYGDERFLIFINGGVVGCGNPAEYVSFKSVKLYRTIEATDTQKATITFMSNGGSAVEEYYLAPGTEVAAPADPTKEGNNFTGWYTDKDCTNKYEFSVMPNTALVLYAGWEKAGTSIADCDLMGGTITMLDAGTYEITNAADKYVLKKTATGGEWSCAILPMTGKKLEGYNVFRVEVQGPKGAQIMFKINDESAGENFITCTGEKQYLEIEFDLTLNANKSLVLCAGAGTAGETGEFTITKLAYGNYISYVNLIRNTEAWADNDNLGDATIHAYDYKVENGVLTLNKLAAGGEWSCLVLPAWDNMPSLANFDKLVVRVKGTEGKQILVKANDTKEFWITCDGTVQTFEYDIDFEINKTKNIMVLFACGGTAGVSDAFEIYELAYVMTSVPEPAVEPKTVDLMGGTITMLDEGSYELTNEATKYVVKKTAAGQAWQCVVLPMTDKDLTGLTVFRAEIKGTAGEKILFKINDEGAGERWVTCTGEKQLVEFTFDLTLNNAKSLVIFAGAGTDGATGEFTITRLEYANYCEAAYMVRDDYYDNDNKGDETKHAYEYSVNDGALKLKKTAEAGEWSCLCLPAWEGIADVTTFNTLVITVKGPEGKQLLVKANDTKEYWITCDGTVQHFKYDLDFTIDPAKNIMVLFACGGQAGASDEFVIYELTYLYESKNHDVNLLGGTLNVLDAGTYEVTGDEAKYVIKKTATGGEWNCITLPMTGKELSGLNILKVEVQGTAGQQILFKINDEGAGEKWVTCTGEKQYFEFAFDLTLDPNKALVIFAGAGKAGATDEFTITYLAYSNYSSKIDLIGADVALNNGHEVTKADGKLTAKKTTTNGWDCFGLKSGADLSKCTKLVVTVKATEGAKLLVKINDRVEYWKDATGDYATFVFDVTNFEWDTAKSDVIFFCEAGIEGANVQQVEFEFTEIYLY